MPRRVAEAEPPSCVKTEAPRGQVLKTGGAAPELPGVEPRRRRQERGVTGRRRDRPGPPCGNRTRNGPGNGPVAPVKTPYCLRQREVLRPLDEVQHVASQAAAEAVPPLRVGVDREAALHLVVEGTDALADPAPSPQPHSRRLHRVAQGMTRLQRGDVHVGRDHHIPPFARGRSPRRLRPETSLPGRQHIPRTAATSSVPSPWGTSAAALPVPWL